MKDAPPAADEHAREAAEIIESAAAGISPERAKTYLAGRAGRGSPRLTR